MRILVLRPSADAERTAQALRERGHEPVLAPLFTVSRLPEPHPEGPFDAIVLTSSNGAPALSDLPADWRALPVFTVGARTAEGAREAGASDVRSADADRGALVALITDTFPPPARLLLIAGRDRHEDVSSRLSEAGFEAVTWVGYVAEAEKTLPEPAAQALREGKVDAALHYSARGAATFLRLAKAAKLAEQALEPTQICISAAAAEPLIAAGAGTVLVAEYPEEAGLLVALDQVSARNPGGGDGKEKAGAKARPGMAKGAMAESSDAAKPRGGSKRTPPTIDLTAQDQAATDKAAIDKGDTAAAPQDAQAKAVDAAARHAPESVLPTEALPREYKPGSRIGAESEPPSAAGSATATPEAAPRRLLLPLLLAGVAGGIVGAGLVLLLQGRMAGGQDDAAITALRGQVETLQKSASTIDAKATSAGQTASKAEAEARAATSRIGEIANAQGPEAKALAEVTARAAQAEAASKGLAQRLDEALARIGTVETQAKAASGTSPEALAAARLVLAERVRDALGTGRPFAGDVAALAKGGSKTDLAPLQAVAERGAPTRAALLAQFAGHRALFAREVAPLSSSWQDRLLALASRVVTVRPVEGTASSDPATLPLRLENAVAAGEFARAAALWGELPEPARRGSEAFGTALKQRAEADATVAKLAQDAVAALGAGG